MTTNTFSMCSLRRTPVATSLAAFVLSLPMAVALGGTALADSHGGGNAGHGKAASAADSSNDHGDGKSKDNGSKARDKGNDDGAKGRDEGKSADKQRDDSARASNRDNGNDDSSKGRDEGKPGDNKSDDNGKADKDHGKSDDAHGKSDKGHGKSDKDHGKKDKDHGKKDKDHGKKDKDHGKKDKDHGKKDKDHGKKDKDHGKGQHGKPAKPTSGFTGGSGSGAFVGPRAVSAPVVTVLPMRATAAEATALPFTGADPTAPVGVSLILFGAGVLSIAAAGSLRPVR